VLSKGEWGTNWGEVKHDREDEHKAGDGEVNPLDALEIVGALPNILEEYIGSQDRCYHSADSIEGLRNIDAKFRMLGRSANGNWSCQ
jgi:hypothetical protein